jgi:uncharacterized protein YjbJ (UPF0337 family)
MQIGTVDLNKLRSLGDKFAGLVKELVGTLAGNDNLAKAGEAQQERATEQIRALRAELKAEVNDAKAATFERKERAAQAAKG